MKVIDNNTEIQRKGVAFIDGAHGYYQQKYEVIIDGEPCGVLMEVGRRSRNERPVRTFLRGRSRFGTLRAALDPQKFDWKRTETI